MKSLNVIKISDIILNWYSKNGRTLPWRMKGKHNNPYFVLISEFMLQQTKVKTVLPYFDKFINKFENLEKLASSDINEVLLVWKGLGYYNRAIRLHQCSQIIQKVYHGVIPNEYEKLIKLPGIGQYTASSLISLIYDIPSAAVDGNVQRIICRYYNIKQEINQIKNRIIKIANLWLPTEKYSDYTSAIIDFGATLCTPQNPLCQSCPLNFRCMSYLKNTVFEIPNIKKISKKKEYWDVFFIYTNNEKIFIRKNLTKKLYFGLIEFPWIYKKFIKKEINNNKNIFYINHKFTHIDLLARINIINNESIGDILEEQILENLQLISLKDIEQYPTSTLFSKILNKGKILIKQL